MPHPSYGPQAGEPEEKETAEKTTAYNFGIALLILIGALMFMRSIDADSQRALCKDAIKAGCTAAVEKVCK